MPHFDEYHQPSSLSWKKRSNVIQYSNYDDTYGFYYDDVIMGPMSSQITSITNVYSTVYSGVDQRNHQSSASLAFLRGSHRWPVNSSHKGPVTRKMFPFDDFITWIHKRQHIPSRVRFDLSKIYFFYFKLSKWMPILIYPFALPNEPMSFSSNNNRFFSNILSSVWLMLPNLSGIHKQFQYIFHYSWHVP